MLTAIGLGIATVESGAAGAGIGETTTKDLALKSPTGSVTKGHAVGTKEISSGTMTAGAGYVKPKFCVKTIGLVAAGAAPTMQGTIEDVGTTTVVAGTMTFVVGEESPALGVTKIEVGGEGFAKRAVQNRRHWFDNSRFEYNDRRSWSGKVPTWYSDSW